MPALHGLLPMAGAGAFDGCGNHPPRRVQGHERTRFHPAIHAAALGSRWTGLAGKTGWRLHFSGRRRLLGASRQAAAVPRFSEPLEFSRLRKSPPGHPGPCRRGGIPAAHRSSQVDWINVRQRRSLSSDMNLIIRGEILKLVADKKIGHSLVNVALYHFES
jgi:hypothetical protein